MARTVKRTSIRLIHILGVAASQSVSRTTTSGASAEPYGICKVIPPEGWKPQFAIDKRRFRFRTRIQAVHELQERSASAKAAQAFYEDFNAFLKAHNKPLKKTPVYSGQEIDLCKLFRVVSRRGGYDQATEDKAWRDVCRILQVKDKSSNAAYTVRKLYQQHLLPYEAYCKVRPASTQPAAAKAAKKASSKSASPPAADHRQLSQSNEEIADAAEAAQILEAMLGMGSGHMEEDDDEEPPLKRLKLEDEVDPSRARSEAAADKIRVPDNIYELNCELCKGGHHEDKIILCDKCDRGCHMFCLTPPLEDVPEGEWICPLCLAEEADAFAFKDGHEFTLEDFQKQAATFKRDMFGGEAAARKVTDDELEAEFWRIVEEGEEPIEVWYGADLDTSIVGSGFPRKDVSDDPYAAAPWNLNNIPKLEGEYGSMLRHIEDNIQGVMVPWLYVGMLYSSFCWHIEDHMFYSINYHHWGEPKKWYGVPSSAAATFEDAFKKALPDHFEKQPDLLFHLVTMLSPKILRQHGVPVYSTVQEEGQFVITFPNSYHGGFNQGFNCAEAVNFASADWLRYGAPSCQRYRSFRKPSLIAHEWLLLKVAKEDRDPRTAFFVRQDLLRVIAEEREWRSRLWSQGVRRARRITQPVGMDKGASDDAECAICHMYVHCSAVECDCCPRRRVCLHHAHNLCECEPARWRLAFRYSLADLERILEDVTRNAGDYEEACAEPLLNGQFPASPIDPDGERADGENADSAEHENGDQGSGSQSERDYSPEPVLRKKYPTRGSIKAEVEALEALDPFSALADLAAFAEKEADQKSPRSARTSPAKQNGRPSSSRSLSPPCKLAEEEETEAPGATTPPPMEAEPAAIEVKPETPDVQKQVTAWQQQLHEQHQAWHARAKQVLEVGGAKVAELDALIVETEQYAWGGAEFEDVPPVLARLRQAKAWVAQVNGFVKNKPTLEAVAPVLAWDPAPVYVSGFVKLKEGAAGAQAWLGRAAEVLADKHVVELRVLEALVTEASRFPISLPDSKVLRERLTAARKVAEAIRLALPTGSGRVKRKGEEQLNMQHLRDLRVQAGALRVDMAELATLSNTLERLDAFQRKIKAALTIKPALVQLQELEAEAETLPVAVPEMDAVAALMQKASDWLGRASALAQQRAPLKKMREVLHAGLRLAVEIPAVESLRLEIRRREWEETAKKALSGRFTLTALLETLEDAPAYGAAQTDLARNLQAKADKAQEWDASATAFFAAVEAAAAAAQQGTAGSLGQANGDALGGQRAVELEALVEAGKGVAVKLESLTKANQLLNAANNWLRQAQRCLVEGYEPEDQPSLSQIEKLIDASENLSVSMAETALLVAKRDQARAWISKAQTVLDEPSSQDVLETLQALVEEGGAVELQMDELEELQRRILALGWAKKTRHLLAAAAAAARPQSRATHHHQHAQHAGHQVLAEALALVAEGRQLPVDQLLLMQLTRLTDTAQDWEARVYNALVGRRAEAGAAQVKWTSVGELTALLGEGRSLGLRLEGLPRLHATLEDHQAWEGRMRLVMTAGTGKPMYEQLAALQDASADNPVASALQAQVYGAVAAADEWREKGRRYIAKRNSGQRLDKGLAHLASSLARALDQLDHRLQEERRRAEAGLPAPEPVAEVAPSSSQASKKRKASPSPERYEENEQDLFCVCQQPYNVDTAMISCDTCNDWYHLRCVNMTQAVAKSLKKYTCPVCAALKGNGAELEAAVAKIRKTRCPDRVALAELLAEAKALACQVEELPALTHVVSAFDRWQGAVEAALEVHESAIEPQEPGPAAAGMRLSPAVLAQLLKSTLSLEIDCSALMKRIMSDLRSERWRTKAEQALRPNSKATVEVLLKLVKEAEGLGISLAHDRTGAQLAQRANAGRQWLDRCRDVLADLKVKGQAEAVLLQRIADAEKLAEEAPSLGVRVDKELERLQECAKLYCLCRQPYDEQRPMLSCDYCQDWFHYECVGLNAPNDDEEDEEVAPEDYRCPNCCAKMRLPYPLYEKLPIRSQQQLLRQAVAAHAAAEQQQQQQGAGGAAGAAGRSAGDRQLPCCSAAGVWPGCQERPG
ncbi:hypothetical protein WJX72_003401 [[Myrmecia] bisecta]|uniref:[Histone H3]-trimethyl-L-lysine(4) demethylase n=1 Tax=[Myrmecia] bisecta TaxID=41462 RepID=A0AAW1QEP3_9CHLO